MSIDTAKVRKVCEAATPGPWQVYDSCSWRRIGLAREHKEILWPSTNRSDGHPELDGINREADLEFIVTARTALPEVLDALDAAEKERDEARRDKSQLYETLATTQADARKLFWKTRRTERELPHECNPLECDCETTHPTPESLEALVSLAIERHNRRYGANSPFSINTLRDCARAAVESLESHPEALGHREMEAAVVDGLYAERDELSAKIERLWTVVRAAKSLRNRCRVLGWPDKTSHCSRFDVALSELEEPAVPHPPPDGLEGLMEREFYLRKTGSSRMLISRGDFLDALRAAVEMCEGVIMEHPLPPSASETLVAALRAVRLGGK
jgi:hypothetical protein